MGGIFWHGPRRILPICWVTYMCRHFDLFFTFAESSTIFLGQFFISFNRCPIFLCQFHSFRVLSGTISIFRPFFCKLAGSDFFGSQVFDGRGHPYDFFCGVHTPPPPPPKQNFEISLKVYQNSAKPITYIKQSTKRSNCIKFSKI